MNPAAPPAAPAPAVPVRYDYLDALRGLAFLGVLSIHVAAGTGQAFPGARVAVAGKYGVQLFFMVSAFTIFLTLDRARWKGWRTPAEFFVRRFFRVLPMFWVGLVLYAFVPGRAPMYAGLHFTPLQYGLTALLQHGWRPRLINSLVPGGWSIAVEGTFYLVAPLLFRWVRTWQAALWLLLGSLGVGALAHAGVMTLYDHRELFTREPRWLVEPFLDDWFPAQLPVFAAGVLAYHLAGHLERRPAWTRPTGALLLAVAAVWLAASVDIGTHGPVPEHVFFALGFLPLLLGLRTWPAAALVNPATRFLGRISYSAYLLHFAVLEAASNSLKTFLEPEWQESGLAYALLGVLTLAGTVPLAWLAHRYVERPGIDLGAKLIRLRRAAAGADAMPASPELAAVAGR